jgi:hypothetical protein
MAAVFALVTFSAFADMDQTKHEEMKHEKHVKHMKHVKHEKMKHEDKETR